MKQFYFVLTGGTNRWRQLLSDQFSVASVCNGDGNDSSKSRAGNNSLFLYPLSTGPPQGLFSGSSHSIVSNGIQPAGVFSASTAFKTPCSSLHTSLRKRGRTGYCQVNLIKSEQVTPNINNLHKDHEDSDLHIWFKTLYNLLFLLFWYYVITVMC